ncbi:MAG: Replication-relaxation [Streptosporangiaceae bacterium]|jgi:hypothetical protein|nr:Replication-relaxation [Streptosporangiaceae bacterium]MDX6429197.1 Replication-relaxation [Streptosporangiaceae bacterium]
MTNSDQQVSLSAGRETLSGFAAFALTCLYQHRLLTTGQIRRLLLPEARSGYATRELRTLRTLGLVANVRDRGTHEAAWFLTAAARRWWRVAERSPPGPTG